MASVPEVHLHVAVWGSRWDTATGAQTSPSLRHLLWTGCSAGRVAWRGNRLLLLAAPGCWGTRERPCTVGQTGGHAEAELHLLSC